MTKPTPREVGRREVERLVHAFRTHAADYRRPTSTYNETQVRTDFLDPLLRALRWDIDNAKTLTQDLREVVQEVTVEVGEDERSKKPDYAFRVGRSFKFFLEAKKPSIRVGEHQGSAFQARRYGFSASHPIAILSNFDTTIIYRSVEPPHEDDDPRLGIVSRYSSEELLSRFDELFDTVSREAAYGGGFDATFAPDAPVTGYRQFDEFFLEQIESWRQRLAQDISQSNPRLSSRELNFFVQRILNRVIFLRICEDRHLERYESLRRLRPGSTYADLKALFAHAEARYDSGLFALLEDPTLGLAVDNDVLRGILEELYYPRSPYTFAVVDAGVLGAIYDQFIAKQTEIGADRSVVLREKPEVRIKGGVFVTPRDVATEIVRRTLEPLALGRPSDEILRLRVADIACGSGVFLLSAFEYLTNRLLDAYLHEGVEQNRGERIYEVGAGQWRVTLATKRQLLVDCLFGVDIDEQAAEVARFGLLLKLLEDETEESVQSYITRSGQRALPSLNENIKRGNSLVDERRFRRYLPEASEEQWTAADPLDWRCEFTAVREGGFSAIVGNPPYLRIQNLVHYAPDEARFYQSEDSGYATAQQDNFDKYQLFVERGLELLRGDGRLGFIVPHRFLLLKSGMALRKLLSSERVLREIVHFGIQQVFITSTTTSTTYTCLLFLEKSRGDQFVFEHVGALDNWRRGQPGLRTEHPATDLSAEPWVFPPPSWDSLFDRLRSNARKSLRDVAKIFVGVQTSADKIYIVRPTSENGTSVSFTDKNGRDWTIERDILRPCLYDAQLEAFSQPTANAFIIFPYELGRRAVPISPAAMRERFPNALRYLEAHKQELSQRSVQGGSEAEWYRYGRSQGLTSIDGTKIILPTLAVEPTYTIDRQDIVVTGGGNGPYYLVRPKPAPGWPIEFLEALLSYPVLEAMVRAGASTFRGGYYSRGKQFIAPLPMPNLDINDATDRERIERVVAIVQSIMRTVAQASEATLPRDKEDAARRGRAMREELYRELDELYGVPTELRQEIEASFAGPEEGVAP